MYNVCITYLHYTYYYRRVQANARVHTTFLVDLIKFRRASGNIISRRLIYYYHFDDVCTVRIILRYYLLQKLPKKKNLKS